MGMALIGGILIIGVVGIIIFAVVVSLDKKDKE